MAEERVFDPELRLIKDDEYYLFYEMLMQSLKTDNVLEGVDKSLSLLRLYLNSGSIALYKKDEDGTYERKINDNEDEQVLSYIKNIVNKASFLAEKKGSLNIDLNISEDIKNMMLIHLKLIDADCILSISNYDCTRIQDPKFWVQIKDTMQIILKRAASYERNTKAISMDLLTGLDNRNSYEMRLRALDEADQDLIFGIFDLFRLKYINDNFSHEAGDNYIKGSAHVLEKLWPKEKTKSDSTGHCVYRIGGDEFVLLTNAESFEYAEFKAGLAAEEVSMLDLGLDDDNTPLGLNCGLVKHNPGDSIKATYKRADSVLSEDKRKMYTRLGLDRRH